MVRLFTAVATTILAACSSPEQSDPRLDQMAKDRGFDSFDEMARRDLQARLEARAKRDKRVNEEPYAEEGDGDEDNDAPAASFAGRRCTQDCSGHRAGYESAEEKGITDPDQCGGKSQSFIEGCQAYADEQQSFF